LQLFVIHQQLLCDQLLELIEHLKPLKRKNPFHLEGIFVGALCWSEFESVEERCDTSFGGELLKLMKECCIRLFSVYKILKISHLWVILKNKI
jgi:hypothetical protein